jgi:hypothetical protein
MDLSYILDPSSSTRRRQQLSAQENDENKNEVIVQPVRVKFAPKAWKRTYHVEHPVSTRNTYYPNLIINT